MAPWWISGLAGAALLGGGVTAVDRAIWRAQKPTPELQFARTACAASPKWRVIYSSGEGAIRSEGEGWWMPGNSAVGTQVCGKGTLQVVAEGEEVMAKGAVAKGPPEMLVTLDGRPLASVAVNSQKTFEIKVPHSGNLQVFYLNDLYESEARLIEFRNLRLTSRKCPFVTDVSVPSEKGGGWASVPKIGTLFSNLSGTIRPCDAGRLSMTVRGQVAQGRKSILRITQRGEVLLERAVPSEKTRLELDVLGEPLQIQLLNPYAQQLYTRNLRLTSLSWQSNP